MSLLILFTNTRSYVTVSDPGTGGAGGGSYSSGQVHHYPRQPTVVLDDTPETISEDSSEVISEGVETLPQVSSPAPEAPRPKVVLKELPSLTEVLSWQVDVHDHSPQEEKRVEAPTIEQTPEEPILAAPVEASTAVIVSPLLDFTDEEILILFYMANNT